MRALAFALLLATAPQLAAAASAEEIDRLWQALEMPQVIAIMHEEGLAYGQSLDADMLAGQASARFSATVAAIYDTDRMADATHASFAEALAEADLAPAIAFFDGPAGRRAIAHELEARRALLDPATEAAARAQARRIARSNPRRHAALQDFIAANDLIDLNVAGTLNANLAFFAGLAQAGAFGEEMDEGERLREVWAQEPAVREDTADWIAGFVTLAYSELSDSELDQYLAFSRTAPGREVNHALFAAFDAAFVDISHELGAAVGRELAGQDL